MKCLLVAAGNETAESVTCLVAAACDERSEIITCRS